jgi:hypothetical protein
VVEPMIVKTDGGVDGVAAEWDRFESWAEVTTT